MGNHWKMGMSWGLTLTGWWFGTMEFYDFPYIGNFIIPTDELSFFRGVGSNHQKWLNQAVIPWADPPSIAALRGCQIQTLGT